MIPARVAVRPGPTSHGRVRLGVAILAGILLVASLYYWLVEGFTVVEAIYQTVTTISTVGFREVRELDTSGRVFTIGLIVGGVGAAFYTATAFFEELVEGQIGHMGRRQMERRVKRLSGHTVVCGYGRVGRTVARLVDPVQGAVVIETDPDRVQAASDAGFAVVHGDATEDGIMAAAGLDRAATLVSALPTDSDNVYVVLSGRAMRPDLHIVARARAESSEAKLLRAGADRVINPQEIGARRIAAFALQPAVSDFLDVVMHGAGAVEYRLEEISIPADAPVVGQSIRAAHIRDHTGALVLALRDGEQRFFTNPPPEMQLEAGMTVIAIGTGEQLERLHHFVTGTKAPGPGSGLAEDVDRSA